MSDINDITNEFTTTASGNPTGGRTTGVGLDINWQDGTLLDEQGNRLEKNGAFVEDVIQAAIARLEFFNSSKFRCRENSLAITKLEEALHWLNARTNRRTVAGIEGSHQEDAEAQS